MNYLEKYDLWMKNTTGDLKEELINMSDNDKKEAFTNDLEFGTGGMRGILGAGTNRMNAYIIRKVTLGFARYIKSLTTTKNGVVIAHDNRHFSKEFSLEAAKVLASEGIKVYLFDGLRPTPELSFAIRYTKAAAGIMITASHNPKEYNGYKIYDEDGCQLTTYAANSVIDEINKIDDIFNIETSKNNELINYVGKEIDDAFRSLINTLPINKNLKKNFKIVYTPLHGTGGVHVPDVLRMNGYDCTPVSMQMINDPDFSSVKSANPEEKDAFIEAIKLGHEIGAILLLATDPDADRMGVATLHNGEFVLLNGNQTGAVILNYLLKNKAQKNDCVFSTIVSSPMVVDMAKKMGLYTKSVLTGFKFIGEQIKLIEGTDKRYLFGYEESYGCLLTDQMRDKDSVGACLILSEIAAFYNEKGMSLVDALDEIYEEYGYYLESLKNIGLKGLEGSKKINEIMEYFRNNELDIKGIISKLDYKKGIDDLPKSNVLKYEMDNGSWFVLRPSGTEPKIKIYYGVKGTSHEDANKRMEELKALVDKEMNKIL